MSLSHRPLLHAPEHLPLDEATLRRLERVYRRAEPDPLFRRRLRGQVVNRFVAEREGYLRRPRSRREMGRLGRAVLYASVGLALSVSAAGAAADGSLPGDPLYAMKLQLEEVRMRIAPPSVRDDLAAMALGERVEELERLVAAGAWRLVPAAAARVTDAESTLHDLDPGAGATAAGEALAVLEAVLAAAPPQAHDGLARALEGVTVHAVAEPGSRPVKRLRPERQRPEAPSAPTAPATPETSGTTGSRRAAHRRPAGADRSSSRTSEDGVEANPYPVPARGAG